MTSPHAARAVRSRAASRAPARSVLTIAAFAPVLVACREAPAVRAAQHGELTLLAAEISQDEHAARLSLSEAAAIARAVASRELTQATGDATSARVREVRACAPELEDALRNRMDAGDAAAPDAAMALRDADRMGAGEARRYLGRPEDGWRAVGTRGLVRGGDRDARRAALLDPSPLVRRAALRAMTEARDEGEAEVEPVFEVARLDPDPMTRTDAVRFLARVGRAGRDVALRLGDLYPSADDAVREDIGAAWAAPGIFEHGGRGALTLLLAGEPGPGTLSAAGAVLREVGARDTELTGAARSLVARAIASGSLRTRLHAIALAAAPAAVGQPHVDAVTAALEDAAKDADPEVRVSALGRLAAAGGPRREAAIRELEALAAPEGSSPAASRARMLLAAAGDARVQAWLEGDLRSDEASTVLGAVSALIALGRASRAAPALANKDAGVRTNAACEILVAARVGVAAEPR